MSIYQFASPSPVREVVFRHANDRPPVALLSAGDNASATVLTNIRCRLTEAGWNCAPVVIAGKPLLQVSGFGQEQHLLNFMRHRRFTSGTPGFSAEPGDNPVRTASEWLEDTSLKTAGWLNLIGDGALLASGIMSGRSKEITAGALYTAGAGVLARYGNVKTEHHVREVLEQTGEFLKKQAVNMPDDCGLSVVMRDMKTGVIADAESFMYRYPSEVMLGAYTMGAFTMLQSGIKQGNPFGIAYGASSVGLKAASLLIPEKHKTEDEKKACANQGPLAQFTDWVQEKPLRIFGFGSLVTDLFLGASAYQEYKSDPRQMGAIFKFVTTGTYLLADVLMAMSNKNTAADGQFDAEEQLRIEALVAETIARQPKELQAALANNTAGFLVSHAHMRGTAQEIARSIMEQAQHMRQNPWTFRADASLSNQPSALR